MRVLITGGTGFLGKHLAKRLHKEGHSVIIFSRTESKQAKMAESFPEFSYALGDIRVYSDCISAMTIFGSVDTVIHTAALKRVDSCEDNPVVAIDTNINGSTNILRACDESGVKKAVLISTDKAYHPHTFYGSTKYTAEGLFRFWKGSVKAVVVRYGNVIGSTGSVFQLWQSQYDKDKKIIVRDRDMTRFFWGVDVAADFVIETIKDSTDKNLFIPKIKSLKIYEMARYIYPDAQIVISPPVHNEKTHEKMSASQCSSENYCDPKIHECLNGYLQRR